MARQIPLPLAATAAPGRIVTGNANAAVLDALAQSASWPFHTAILFGPPRSGKSLLARWFVASGAGEAVDDAEQIDETALFHRWNRAQESGTPLLLVVNAALGDWQVSLPDLASRLGAALHLEIGVPDEAMLGDLLTLHAEQRGFSLGAEAAAYLVPRVGRSHLDVERLVETIDRLSLERKQAPTLSLWREALEEIDGPKQRGLF